MRRTFGGMILLLSLHGGPAAFAQTARIDRIASLQEGSLQEIRGTTKKLRAKPRDSGWLQGKEGLPLYPGYAVYVEPNIYSALSFANKSGTVTHWAPQTLLPIETGAAAYEVTEDTLQVMSRWQFILHRGSIIASDLGDWLRLRSSTVEVLHTGTKVLMTVEPQSQETFVYVQEGSALVRQVQGKSSLALGAGQAARSDSLGALSLVGLGVPEAASLDFLMRSQEASLWSGMESPGLLGRWYVRVPLIAVSSAVLGAVFYEEVLKPGKQSLTGTIRIEVPK